LEDWPPPKLPNFPPIPRLPLSHLPRRLGDGGGSRPKLFLSVHPRSPSSPPSTVCGGYNRGLFPKSPRNLTLVFLFPLSYYPGHFQRWFPSTSVRCRVLEFFPSHPFLFFQRSFLLFDFSLFPVRFTHCLLARICDRPPSPLLLSCLSACTRIRPTLVFAHFHVSRSPTPLCPC